VKDNMDAFIHRFEIYATTQKWPENKWAVYLGALLRGKALEVYSRLSIDDANDYGILKNALLRRFNFTEEGFKRKFHTAKPEVNEAPAQFIARLSNYFSRWLDFSGIEKTFEALRDLMIREQYLDACTVDLAVFLRERALTDLAELAEVAQKYLDARITRGHHYKTSKADEKPNADVSNQTKTDKSIRAVKTCFTCNKPGHLAKDCFRNKKTAAMTHFRRNQRDLQSKEQVGLTTLVNKQVKQITGGQVTDTNNHEMYRKEVKGLSDKILCKAHKLEHCRDCLDLPKYHCHGIHGAEVELHCGCIIPNVTDACKQRESSHVDDVMPVLNGYLGDKPVSVLRDTGCSTIVVRRNLVDEDQLTGSNETCVLIDGTIRRVPVAEVTLNTPFFKGTIKAVCMRNPLYDVIIGNVPGACDAASSSVALVEHEHEVSAVVTRQQEQRDKKQDKPLKVTDAVDGNITKDLLVQMQCDDSSLKSRWDNIRGNSGQDTGIAYVIRKDLLYRVSYDKDGKEIHQLVVPEEMRTKVLKLAHESIMSGHLGIKKTKDRIWKSFWWRDLNGSVTRWVRSCDICQRTISKGRTSNVPLGKMPIIDTPFDRVAVDLIGPIVPASEKGNRYILTMVDYATRYPEAVALKDITAETVAEALVNMFSRVGIPREILSDQGGQFLSSVMKEVSRLLSMQQKVTTPYHPMCNGLVEKFNGTLKMMLKRMCSERPKDWDRYIGPILFAYREVPQESLGFSPFELLYGREVRGPMRILRELWTQEAIDPEVRTTYQYIVDLKDRLEKTCQLAHEELRKAQSKQQKYFNRKVKERRFQEGDKVLGLRPTDKNKLLMQWQGPHEVIQHIRDNNYKIRMETRTRTYHANMLKAYIVRDSEMVSVANAAVIEPEDDSEDMLELYSVKQTESYKDVDINPELSAEQQEQLRSLVYEFRDVFSDLPGVCNLGKHNIKLTTNEPVNSKPYPLPYAMRVVVDQEIDAMLKMKIIEPSSSPYASPMVIVKKQDGHSHRVCIDFRKINKITIFDAEPMTQIPEIFAKLSEDKFLSKFDFSKGYWQIEVALEDREKTAFISHRGLYQFRVMPFGCVNAPATFNRIMRRLLEGSQNLDNFLDDALAHTKEWEEHLCTLRDFLTRVRKANLTLRPSKCAIGYTSVDFLGHKIGASSIQPKQDTLQKIIDALRPKTKKQLRSFLGLVGFYRQFIPNFAAIAVPLTDLTRKGQPNEILWEQSQENAFNTLKGYITKPPILRLPNLEKEFVLQTDASNDGIGAILLQEELGVKHPIAFASKKFLPREKNYSTIEKECMAIVWGILKFQTYLYGRNFILETDHQPLQYLQKAKFQNGRLMRWALSLQPFKFTVHAIKGSDNVGADFLSRNCCE
jgi:transposase InsO family protein